MKILVVDDQEMNRKVIRAMLRPEGHEVLDAVDGLAALEVLRREGADAVVCDVLMPRMDGYRLCYEVRAAPDLRAIPIVIYTATYTSASDEKLALSVGADAFVRKPAPAATILEAIERARADRSERRVPASPANGLTVLKEYSEALVRKLEERNRELEETRDRLLDDIRGRTAAEAAHRRSEERFRRLFDSNTIGIAIADLEGNITEANGAYLSMLGFDRADLASPALNWVRLTPPEHHARDAQSVDELRRTGVAAPWEKELLRRDGSRVPVLIGVASLSASEGTVLAYAIDLTHQKKLEEQFRQSQKMEAIGMLAGGVAHDFNNVLTVILGFGELLAARFPADDPARGEVDEILGAAGRAANLTRQLLAFSRRQVLEPAVVDLGSLVRDVERMLARLIGEDVELATRVESSPSWVLADRGQLEQVLLNLAVNARDAMPKGGRLSIEVTNVDLDPGYAVQHAGAGVGPHVLVAVSDSGGGMDAATRDRVFEPFFTTKEKGRGTGLGLSTVYGIVRQSGGWIWLYSEPGLGTTFKIYLPRVTEPGTREEPSSGKDLPRGRGETVLVVEDEPAIRALAQRILAANGYHVLVAADGREAEELVARLVGPLDALVTDLVMPDTTGTELAARLVASRPGLKVLFMSGYTDDTVVRSGLLGEAHAFLQKPFSPQSLVRKVREILS